jgi:hypothetical protein
MGWAGPDKPSLAVLTMGSTGYFEALLLKKLVLHYEWMSSRFLDAGLEDLCHTEFTKRLGEESYRSLFLEQQEEEMKSGDVVRGRRT